MDIYAHFPCYTELPIAIDDVIDQAKENGGAAEYRLHPLNIDPEVLLGMAWKYCEGDKVKAEIVYADIDDNRMIRLVVCKEILHTLENDGVTAASFEAVGHLIDNIVKPPQIQSMLPSALADHLGLLRALSVLIPRDSLDDLRRLLSDGTYSIDMLAELVEVSPEYVSLALSEEWRELVEAIA